MRPTRELTGVLPSAPSQISVPTALRVFRVLSSASGITASASYTRPAVREFRARYCCGTIPPRTREPAPDRGAVTAWTPVGEPHDGELSAQQRRIGREPGERRLAGPRGAGEEMRPAVPDEAGRVHDEPVSFDERERVQDSQEAVDRILVGAGECRARATLRQVRRPHEVPALDDEPSALTVTGDEDVAVRPVTGGLPQVNLDSPVGRPGRQEALVSVTDDIEDVAVSRHDRAAQTGDLDAQLIHTA